MADIFENIRVMTVERLNKLRVNASIKVKSSSTQDHAAKVLSAIDDELARRYLPGMIERFKSNFPGGFYGEKQSIEEREYKQATCNKFDELLNEVSFKELLDIEDYDELFNRVKILVEMTNFLQGSFEKPKLFDAIKADPATYMTSLYRMLWGSEQFEVRLADYFSAMEQLGLSKWTYVSYFLFLSNPVELMFVKPDMLKRSLELSKYPVEYQSSPTVSLYLQIIEFSQWLKHRIAELEPRDMIDVHSFMWHMAPTGKWSEV